MDVSDTAADASPGSEDAAATSNGDHEAALGNPKLYKTTLCQFYLQGPCKNGDSCSYAHGTSDLRTSSGVQVRDVEAAAGDKKIKSKLCEKFLQFGMCQFGPSCNFAHGVRELQKAISTLNPASNPAYKTSLCKSYMSGMYCQFADKCQYAHGQHELREKPFTPPGDLPDDVKLKLIAKAKARHDYKTKLCTNFEENGFCEYDDLCHYAHGKDELQESKEPNPNQSGGAASGGGVVGGGGKRYKTVMCKNGANCTYGESCQFAHSPGELRQGGPPAITASNMRYGGFTQMPARPPPQGSNFKTTLCKNYVANQQCQYGPNCQFAHGPHELRPAHSAMASPGAKFKTAMCQSVVARVPCPKGATCHFAHSPIELRPPGAHPMMTGGSGPPPPPPSSYHQQPASVGGAKYKTVMCTNISNSGQCSRGSSCNFAHSYTEMMEARNADPRYKTALCENYKKDGTCEKGSMCVFAHGAAELRAKVPPAPSTTPASYFGSGGGFGQSSNYGYGTSGYGAAGYGSSGYGSSSGYGGRSDLFPYQSGYGAPPYPASSSEVNDNPKYKTVLCQSFMAKGYCDRDRACSFAHGVADLSNSDSYKTAMCRNMTAEGTCPKGNVCHFAHSADELRTATTGGNGGGGNGNGNGNGSADGAPRMKRKQGNVKTVLCQNFQTFKECPFNESCTFAHGEEELQINKRQRL